MAREMNSKIIATSGPAIERVGDLIGILTNLEDGNILFIDEIHRLPKVVEEFIYSAMGDFKIDFIVDEGPYAKTIKFTLKRFTLIGATNTDDFSKISRALKNSFLCAYNFQEYTREEISRIIIKLLASKNIKFVNSIPSIVSGKVGLNPGNCVNLVRRIESYLKLSQTNLLTESALMDALAVFEHNIDNDSEDMGDRQISEKVRIAVWRRDNGKCAKCGNRKKLEYDHIIPVSKGGGNTVRNIELLCELCNRRKKDHIR
jgi:Holliday junction DNA helicase RuvB